MEPDLVIFDCDGVLVDSEIIAARIEAELITAAGFPITAEEMAERYAGLTFHDILLQIEKEADVPLQASLLESAEKLVDEKLAREVMEIEGARKAVASVKGPKCICSNSSAHRLDAMLDRTGLAMFFPKGSIISAKSNPALRPKPAPDVFLHAAEMFGADADGTFVIEDSVHGVTGARLAGMRVIGFTGAAHSYPGHADRLTDAGAETVIRRWADLPAVLAALSEWSENA